MKDYQPPEAWPGLPVQYQEVEGAPPAPAIITQVGRGPDGKVMNVGLSVIHPGYMGLTCLEGVRHKSWPSKEQIRASGVGTWDYCPQDPMVPMLNITLGQLTEATDQLVKAHNELMLSVHKLQNKVQELSGLAQRVSDLEVLTAPTTAPPPGQTHKQPADAKKEPKR
jgi:hypothetical protein